MMRFFGDEEKRKLETVDNQKLATTIATVLDEEIKKVPADPQFLDRFWSQTVPPISIKDYILRFMKYSSQPNACYIAMLIYLDFYRFHTQKRLNEFNIHRLIACSFLVASKFSSDCFFNNKAVAKIAGVSLSELNALEKQFYFTGLGCQLYIDEQKYIRYETDVLTRMGGC